ncbi:hypothetical protein [Lichenifustis flavocetrariae]|nr:hypothetical protein [Lichenifustis flavocetrariae]
MTTGSHPDLGSVVTIQDEDPKVAIMHSQFPLDVPPDADEPARTH